MAFFLVQAQQMGQDFTIKPVEGGSDKIKVQ
jgi:hypothetical protein